MLIAATMPAQQPPRTFRSGTRLVEVDVVVRDKDGPVANLDQDDFALYDCSSAIRNCKGKPQRLDLFREINLLPEIKTAAPSATSPPPALTSGEISNRTRTTGEPVSSATVVLVDQLNTPFELKAYQRTQIVDFLKSVGDRNRIAVYSLGQDLHILQDFTDDPKKLMEAVARIDSGNQVGFAQDDGSNAEIGRAEAVALAEWKFEITSGAIQAIVRHMEGVSGRKSLVWVSQGFPLAPPLGLPGMRFLLGQANIAVYPVMVRSLAGNRNIATRYGFRGVPPPPGGVAIATQEDIRRRGESLGGEGFGDVKDALAAVSRAEEDSRNYYVLGFYPAEADLDGATHQLTLEVSKRVSKRPNLTLQYRQVYLAAQPGSKHDTGEDKPSLSDLAFSPLDATAIGLTAAVEPDPQRTGERQIRATIDLNDLQLRHDGDRWTDSIQVSIRDESNTGAAPLTRKLELSFSDAELKARQTSGLTISYPLPGEIQSGSARIVVQDLSNGTAGSIRVPISALAK